MAPREIEDVTSSDSLLVLHAELDAMTRDVARLKARLDRLDRRIAAARTSLEVRHREQHFGRDPVRPFAWRVAPVPPAAEQRRPPARRRRTRVRRATAPA